MLISKCNICHNYFGELMVFQNPTTRESTCKFCDSMKKDFMQILESALLFSNGANFQEVTQKYGLKISNSQIGFNLTMFLRKKLILEKNK